MRLGIYALVAISRPEKSTDNGWRKDFVASVSTARESLRNRKAPVDESGAEA